MDYRKMGQKNYQWTKSYQECCDELKWQSVKERHNMLMCCQVYKILNNLDCLGSTYNIMPTLKLDLVRYLCAYLTHVCIGTHFFYVLVEFLTIIIIYNVFPRIIILSTTFRIFSFNCCSLYLFMLVLIVVVVVILFSSVFLFLFLLLFFCFFFVFVFMPRGVAARGSG